MKKIAFLVEEDFINLHVGVRNYIFSLYLSLKDFYDIDFIAEFVIFLCFNGYCFNHRTKICHYIV